MKVEAESKSFLPYYYLWHLVSLGVIKQEAEDDQISETIWDTLKENNALTPSKVVMIDVGCAFSHPNLRGRVDAELSIDFTVSPYGAKYIPGDGSEAAENKCFFEGLDVSDLRLEHYPSVDKSLFDEVVEHLANSKGETRLNGDVEALFASHGTAVSGLVVGGPEICDDSKKDPSPGVISYFGVDPFSKLISIRTGFDDDPLQFIAALLYAYLNEPDVIVMPRGIPDPVKSAMSPKNDFKADIERWSSREASDLLDRIDRLSATASGIDPTAPQVSATGKRLWDIVQSLIIAISKKVPIVCASGNDGESQLNYPASLASPENGILAVGAVNSHGYRSGYSNYGDGLTLVAPSDDMEIFNLHQLRSTQSRIQEVGYLRGENAEEVKLSHRALLTTDIPGSYGYDTGNEFRVDDELPAQDGFYTNFGGTSGATALVGGVVALIRRAERAANRKDGMRDGCDIKELLSQTARRTMPTPSGAIELSKDSMNAIDEKADAFSDFFGTGLVDAEAAVARALEN